MLLMPTNPKTVLALSIAEQIGIIIALSIMGIIAIMSMKLVLYHHLHGPADNQGTLHTYVCLVLSVALVLLLFLLSSP